MNEKVDFERICNLKSGCKFLWNGGWKIIRYIRHEKIFWKSMNKAGSRGSMSAKSKMFVQVEVKK